MSDDGSTSFATEALALVDAYIADHPGCTRQGVEQPGHGSTNRVVFVRHGEQLLVCKIFCEKERREREAFAMRHWRRTGLVPQMVDEVGERMIVMSYVPGVYLMTSRPCQIDGERAWLSACRETGRAMAKLTRVPLADAQRKAFESRYYREVPTLEAYLGRIMALGRSIHARDGDFGSGFWLRSLDFAASQLPVILAEPRVLYHQDVGNLHVQQECFMGFFDLEMCRVGSASMQLGSSLAYLEKEPAVWAPLREGWEAERGADLGKSDLCAAVAVHHLLCWRVICRYLSYDGTPGGGFAWAGPADPEAYLRSIETVHRTTGVELPA